MSLNAVTARHRAHPVLTQRSAPSSEFLRGTARYHTGTSDVVRASTWWRQQRTGTKGEPTISQIPLLGTCPHPTPGGSECSPQPRTITLLDETMQFYSVQVWRSRDPLQFPLQVQPAFHIHGMMFPGKRTLLKQSTVCTGQKLLRGIRPEISRAHRHIWLEPYLLSRGASNFFSISLSFPEEYQLPLLFNVLS